MRRAWHFWIVAAALAAACAEPPSKEMNQAQGAIDAARAAGADRYAETEYRAATDALQRSHDAVAARDFRLALNHALDARERAQDAARAAADNRARLRGEAERAMAETATLLAAASTRLADVQKMRGVNRRALRGPAATIEAVTRDVQKAGAAMKGDDNAAAPSILQGLRARIEGATAAIDAAAVQPPKRRR